MTKSDKIRELLEKNWSQKRIALELGVSQPLISQVKNGTGPNRKFSIRKWIAKKKGIEWNLDINKLEFPEKCPYLGIKIDYTCSQGKGSKDNYPSLDRINPKEGYTNENVIVCSNRANRIKQDSTMEELELILNKLKQININK